MVEQRGSKMIRTFINPDYSQIPLHADNGGIRRVAEGMMEHFHKFGVEVVHYPSEAEVIINHGSALLDIPGVPNISVSHGLYWSRQPWGEGTHDVNRLVVESMRHSVAWTVPSEWVNVAVRRGGLFYPEVVYHGVDANQFTPSLTNGGYVLWNKLRQDFVSDSGDMQKLAQRMTHRQFVSTIGRQDDNVTLVGKVSHKEMQKLVAEAGVYLSTARETFGIGTLEAMACGVPIVGWDWGGTAEIVVNGQTGYLAYPGDYAGLAECVDRCFAERDRLSQNAIADVKARWGWEARIEQYANIVKRVHANWYAPDVPKVSVLITAYKLDQYLPACIESVIQQTHQDFECIVVDDAQLKSTETIVRDYAQRDARVRYVPTPHNFGLVGARNYGFTISRGRYIRHLDADDFLALNALELEVTALDKDRGTDIVYGHLEVVHEDGSQIKDSKGNVQRGGWPAQDFNWYAQMAHLNQLPSCVMARRTVYERAGGYRERMTRNEDAEFWCRVTSLGLRAEKFTQAVTYYHRDRNDSKGAKEWATEGA
jgi:GT2 family glycosyltransferase